MEKNKEDDENHLVEEQKQENGLLLSENEKVLKDFGKKSRNNFSRVRSTFFLCCLKNL